MSKMVIEIDEGNISDKNVNIVSNLIGTRP